ncbi:putative Ca2+/H+ antiporter (TMEM165/GDT1 family) [Bradyrhizobium sp. USDA 4369]
MTSKTIALKILDSIFIAASTFLLLLVAGLPAEWIMALLEMSLREFQAFALFVIFGSLILIHAIATSDSAP